MMVNKTDPLRPYDDARSRVHQGSAGLDPVGTAQPAVCRRPRTPPPSGHSGWPWDRRLAALIRLLDPEITANANEGDLIAPLASAEHEAGVHQLLAALGS